MNPIRVKTEWIIEKLSLHKQGYSKSFTAIVDAWKALDAKYQEDYRAYSARVATQTLKEDEQQPYPPPKPESRIKTYDFYLSLFMDDRNEDQELDEDDYRRFIKDEWEWMGQHRSILAHYLSAGSMTSTSISADTTATLASMKEYYDSRLE